MKAVNATHLYFSKECTLGFAMSTSLYQDRAIDSLLIEHLRAKRDRQKLINQNSSLKDTATSNV